MKPREMRRAWRADERYRREHATRPVVDLLDHPWHEPTREELEHVARVRVARYLPGLRGGWDALDDDVRDAQIELVRIYVADVVGPTAVRVLEQAAERAPGDLGHVLGPDRVAQVVSWLEGLSQEVEV